MMNRQQLEEFAANVQQRNPNQDFQFSFTPLPLGTRVEVSRELHGRREQASLITAEAESYSNFHKRFWDAILANPTMR